MNQKFDLIKNLESSRENEIKARLKEVSVENKDDYEEVRKFIENHLHREAQEEIFDSFQISEVLTLLKNVGENTVKELRGEEILWRSITSQLIPLIFTYFSSILEDQKIRLEKSKSRDEDDKHQQLSAVETQLFFSTLHKTIRTIVIFLKALISLRHPLTKEVDKVGHDIADILLMSRLDIALDIKCNMGLCLTQMFIISLGEESIDLLMFILNPEDAKERENPLENKMKELCKSEMNRIVLSIGILSSFTEIGQLKISDDQIASLLYELGNDLIKLDHGAKEIKNLGASRALDIWLDKIVQRKESVKLLDRLAPLFPSLEFFIFNKMDFHIDAVKNCCRSILCNLSILYDYMSLEDDSNLYKLLLQLFRKPTHVKWIGISCVVRNSPKSLHSIYLIEKSIPFSLLTCERMFVHPATEAYIALMKHHFEAKHPQFEEIWLDPLFHVQETLRTETNWPQKRAILLSLFCPTRTGNEGIVELLLSSVLSKMQCGKFSFPRTESSLLAVEILKVASERKMSSVISSNDNNENSFRGIVPKDVLHSWFFSANKQIRLAGFSLLIESKKSSEVFTIADFESLKVFFKYNIVNQSPAFRQQFISYFKKLMKRLTDSRSLLKRQKNLKALESYTDFFNWLWNFLTEDEGIHEGANFARRCQSLECLSLLTENFKMEEFLKFELNSSPFFSSLIDTYEVNKSKCLSILSRLPIKDFDKEEECLKYISTACENLFSSRPPESVTGKYLLLLVINKSTFQSSTSWAILNKLFKILDEHVKKIDETSLIEVAAKSPLYGCMAALRAIFCSTKNFIKESEGGLQSYIKEIVNLCFKINYIMFPVLGSPAPEGFLPGLADSSDDKLVVRSLSAQMLLVCSWRSMKEACLLLSDISNVFPIEGENENFIVSYAQIVEIGNHLLYLLKNLMHRGVFEQVFVGFKILSTRLWRSGCRKLNELPETWLNAVVKDEELESKCTITRRSGGLPFIFQALLSGESNNEVFFNKWIHRLFVHQESIKMRIHSMNILRSLFRDAGFSRGMMPFVPLGLKMAFKGLKSGDWNERNSGLMLYGSILRRTFGPKMNLMSGSTFFSKFPLMYDFLLGELEELSAGVHTFSDYTYHVLLLIASFAPPVRVEDEHFKLNKFIYHVQKCGSSPDSHVRRLAAKAIIPLLLNKEEMLLFIATSCESIKSDSKSNEIHGTLIQIHAILSLLKSSCIEEEWEFLKHDLKRSIQPLMTSENITRKCPAILEILVDISSELQGEFWESIYLSYRKCYGNVTNRRFIPCLPNLDMKIVNIVIEKELSLSDNYEKMISWVENENLHFLTQLLNFLVCDDNNFSWNFGVEKTYEFVVKIWRKVMKLVEELNGKNIVEEKMLLFFAILDSNVYLEWLKNNEEEFKQFWKKLFNFLFNPHGTIEAKGGCIRLLFNILFQTPFSIIKDEEFRLCDLFFELTESSCEDELRLAIAHSAPHIPINSINKLQVLNQCKIFMGIFRLLQDDEICVREILHRKLPNETPYCDRKSLEVTMGVYLNSFVSCFPNEGLVALIGLLFRRENEIRVEGDENEEDEDRVFDKSEMNIFAEEVLLAKVLEEELIKLPQLRLQLTDFFLHGIMTPSLYQIFQTLCGESWDEGEISLKAILTNKFHPDSPRNNSTKVEGAKRLVMEIIMKVLNEPIQAMTNSLNAFDLNT